jgi:Uma2 family endonuclease
MGMSQQQKHWVAEDLDRMPDDGQRYEIIDGELFVTPAPVDLHQRAILRLSLRLTPYADACGLDLLCAPSAVPFSRSTVVEPDLLVRPRLPNGRFAEKFSDVGRLLLAVEVLSPRTARLDRGLKRDLYAAQQVPDYWIVDVKARRVERWQPNSAAADICRAHLAWQPLPDCAPLDIDLVALFAAIHGDAA